MGYKHWCKTCEQLGANTKHKIQQMLQLQKSFKLVFYLLYGHGLLLFIYSCISSAVRSLQSELNLVKSEGVKSV